MTAAESLATFTAELRWERVDAATRAQLSAHVLDTLGVICAGIDQPETRSVQTLLQRWGGREEATVVGRAYRLPAPHAAFLNAFAGRIHTFDDTYESGPIHPGSVSVSAALAAAEAHDATGEDFLAAVLAGYEVATRVSAALGPSHYGSGFHNTGTCNALGACAAAARAARLDASATADALGLAGEGAAGLRQYQIDGSMLDSALGGARAAQTGVLAVELQRAGLRGPHGILDGRWGIFAVMSDDGSPGRITEDLGTHYEFTATSLKPYPSCRFTHGPIEVLLALRERHRFHPDEIEAIEIATFRESVEVSDKPTISSRTDAILSHQYAAARAMQDGGVTLAAFDPKSLNEPRVRALAQRVHVVLEPSLQAAYPQKWPHRITVTLKDGRRLTEESENPPSGIERVREKFLQLVIPVLGQDRAERVCTLVTNLESLSKIGELTELLAER